MSKMKFKFSETKIKALAEKKRLINEIIKFRKIFKLRLETSELTEYEKNVLRKTLNHVPDEALTTLSDVKKIHSYYDKTNTLFGSIFGLKFLKISDILTKIKKYLDKMRGYDLSDTPHVKEKLEELITELYNIPTEQLPPYKNLTELHKNMLKPIYNKDKTLSLDQLVNNMKKIFEMFGGE